ncbi:hypothetical protein M885DRAFT_626084 [Pelagophyceae sp. CCMP2097]|nr:hypothetical protein M885DRAFT_626084 [Pelagophyceae sp. CCMP2097]
MMLLALVMVANLAAAMDAKASDRAPRAAPVLPRRRRDTTVEPTIEGAPVAPLTTRGAETLLTGAASAAPSDVQRQKRRKVGPASKAPPHPGEAPRDAEVPSVAPARRSMRARKAPKRT